MRLRHLLPLLCLWGAPATAAAQTDCSGPLSPCENAQGFDLALAPGRFATLEDARTQLDPGKLSVGLAGSYARRPLSLSAASPDPEGRSVPLVRDVWQMDLLVAVGLPHRLQLALGLPLRVAQDGAGIEAVTSRQGGQLPPTAVVDPRVALGWQLFDRVLDGAVSGRARLELTLPLGDELAFAGAPGPTWAPAFVLSAEPSTRWHFSVEAGARLGPVTELADVRFGRNLRFAAGARYSVFDELRVGVEAWMLPSLLTQPETSFGRATHVPAEWLASLGVPFGEGFWLQAGAGTGIPLSAQGTRPGSDARESFIGATAASFRALVLLRVVEH